MKGMATKASKKEFYILFFSILIVVSEEGNITLLSEECKSCSGRADVPCRIEQMPYPCFHAEYHDQWPGKPRNLQSNTQKTEDGRWLANFTWNPPYDSSITSLSGFFLIVNLHPHMDNVFSAGPYCYYANLSGTNWTSLKEPHSVTFHFDCIQVPTKTELHFHLMSSPKPDHDADYADTVIYLGEMTTKNQEVKLKINKTVSVENGENIVKVWFEPIEPDILYHIICLSPKVTDMAYCAEQINLTVKAKVFFGFASNSVYVGVPCETTGHINPQVFGTDNCLENMTIEPPQQECVFTDVPSGDYRIIIRRSSKPILYVTAYFFVPAPPPSTPPSTGPENIDSFQILLIIGCALLAVCTTATIYVMRKYGKLRYCDFIHNCILFNSYQPTAQIQPNNNNGQLIPGTAVRKKVMMIFYPESNPFIEAVEDLSDLITRWGGCDVNMTQSLYTEDRSFQEIVNDCCNDQFICIILSEHINMIYEILNHGEDLPLNTDWLTQFIFELLKKIHSEGKAKAVISFFPGQLENPLLKEEKILTVTELAGPRMETCKENLKHIYQLFHRIHDAQFSIKDLQESLTAGNEQIKKLLESIQKLPRGLVTGEKLYNSNIPVACNQQQNILLDSSILLSGGFSSEGNNNIATKNFQSKSCEKHLETLKWTEEQNRLKNGLAEIKWNADTSDHPFSKTGVNTKVTYEAAENLTCTCDRNDRNCEENDGVLSVEYSRLDEEAPKENICFSGEKSSKKRTHRPFKNSDNHTKLKDYDSLSTGKAPSFRVRRTFGALREDCVYPATGTETFLDEDREFIPPDSDSESDTQSMLFENINRRYLEDIKQEQISQL